MGGRHVFMGYLNDPDNTSSTIDADGFLRTGDVGHTDKFGFIYITGRLKVVKIICHYITGMIHYTLNII